MTLSVVPSRGLVDQVFEQLASEIMSGAYPAGQHLPSERALAESFKVNRQVIREASRRLAQIGLVQVLHGDGTRVLDFRAHGGLDLLAFLLERQSSNRRSMTYWMPILELRCALAPEVVRHCTKRARQSLRDELLQIAIAMSEANDDTRLWELERRFWELIHEGADHLVYRFTYNSFRRCFATIPDQSKAWTAREVRLAGYRLQLAKHIAAGDVARAEREIRESMRAMLEDYEAQLASKKKPAAAKPAPSAPKPKAPRARAITKAAPKKKASAS